MSNFEYLSEPIDEFEKVLGVFYGGRGQVGSKFVVTNRRLLIGPLDTGIAQAILNFGLGQAGAGGEADLLKSVLDAYPPMKTATVWLRHVTGVQPTNNASLFRPPGLRVTTDTAEHYDLGIVKTPTTMNMHAGNNAIRDAAVQLIRSAVESAKAAPEA